MKPQGVVGPALSGDCPQCARFRERLDREKMERYLLDKGFFVVGATVVNGDRAAYEVCKALIAYLTE